MDALPTSTDNKTPATQIRVGLVDDHRIVRHGLQRLLEACPDITVVGTASSGEEALTNLAEWQAQVVVMDLHLPGGIDGLETTRRLRQIQPACQVVVLTSYTDDGRVIAALRAGATGYIRKEAEPEILLAAIRAAAQRQPFFDPAIDPTIWQNYQSPAQSHQPMGTHPQGPHSLTRREHEVLQQVVRNQTNREIAQQLGVSEETVKTHVTNILLKLNLTQRSQVVIAALKHGLVRLDDLSL